jgi:hypothetical protein
MFRRRMNRTARFLPVLAAGMLGCAGLSPLPSQGGRAWLRLESEHFVLYSDLSQSHARSTISAFERLLAAYHQLGWEVRGELPVKLEVVVFSDSSDFEVFAGPVSGFYVGSSLDRSLLVMPSRPLELWTTLKHELTHFIAFQSLPFQPPWLAEGLACYFESAYFDSEQRFVIGRAPRELYQALRRFGRLPVRELMAAESAPPNARFYGSAWLLVHYLMSTQADAFVAYQDALEKGDAPAAAWSTAFPDLPVERLENVLGRYYEVSRYSYFARPIRARTTPEPSLASLSAADIFALRARLFLGCPNCAAAEQDATENIERALLLSPNHLNASLLRIQIGPKVERLTAARALVRAHPTEWLAWSALARVELDSVGVVHRCTPEVVTHLRELGAKSAHALMIAALCQANAGARQDALELAARAMRMQPADAELLFLDASVLRVLRECRALAQLMPRLHGAAHASFTHDQLSGLEGCDQPR